MTTWKEKKLGVIFLMVLVTNSYALPVIIPNFNQLINVLDHGEDVKALIYYERCKINRDSESQPLVANLKDSSTRINFYQFAHSMITTKRGVKDSVATSVEGLSEHETGEFFHNYKRLQIFEDNTAELYIAFYDPVTNEKKLSATWTCQISNGTDNNGLVLFNAGM